MSDTDKEVEALAEIIDESPASHLLTIPGVWEVLSEHFNNEIMDVLEELRVRGDNY